LSRGFHGNPGPNAEARQRRNATEWTKKLLREGMARLQAVLDDRFIIDETPLEASDAMLLAADVMHAALHQCQGTRRRSDAPARAVPGLHQRVRCGQSVLLSWAR